MPSIAAMFIALVAILIIISVAYILYQRVEEKERKSKNFHKKVVFICENSSCSEDGKQDIHHRITSDELVDLIDCPICTKTRKTNIDD